MYVFRKDRELKKAFTLLLLLLLLVSLCSCGLNAEKNIEAGEAAETETLAKGSILYRMKINPEFEISADDNLVVVDVAAKNDDAESVIAAVDVVGLSVSEAFDGLAEEARAQGFLTADKGNTVDITILEKDDEKMPTCHLCNGCGTVMCDECNGTGILDSCVLCGGQGYFHCDACDDTGFVPCEECGGSGINTTPDDGCWACHGSGVCYFCGGAGYTIVTNGGDNSVKINEDGTAETDLCPFCKGAKYCVNCMNKPCNKCNRDGNGERPGFAICYEHNHDFALGSECPDCHGAGVIYCGDSFNGYNWCPCCWGSGIEGTGDPDYKDSF